MAVPGAQEQIHSTIMTWPDITAQPHGPDGTQYCLGKRELGHIHGDYMVDLPFPARVRDELISAGSAQPHHVLPDSGWVTLRLREPAHVEQAIALFRRSYELATSKWARP